MNKTLVLPAAVVLLLVAVNLSFAETPKPPQKDAPSASSAPALKSATGKIDSIDSSKNQMVVEYANGKKRTYIVEAATLATLKVGEKVHISYKTGDNHAQSVKVVDSTKKK